MNRRPLALLCAATSAILSASHASAGAKNPGTYVHLTIADVSTLDPALAYDTPSRNVLANIYEYLVAYGEGGLSDFEPRLATQVP